MSGTTTPSGRTYLFTLNPAQWSLIKWVADQNREGEAVDVQAVMNRPHAASWENVVDLVERGLIEFPDGLPERAPARGDRHRLAATPRGKHLFERWIAPSVSVLVSVYTRGRKGVELPPVRQMVSHYSFLHDLFRGGFIELRSSETGEAVDRPGWDEAFQYDNGQNWPGLRVHVTTAGRPYVQGI